MHILRCFVRIWSCTGHHPLDIMIREDVRARRVLAAAKCQSGLREAPSSEGVRGCKLGVNLCVLIA